MTFDLKTYMPKTLEELEQRTTATLKVLDEEFSYEIEFQRREFPDSSNISIEDNHKD